MLLMALACVPASIRGRLDTLEVELAATRLREEQLADRFAGVEERNIGLTARVAALEIGEGRSVEADGGVPPEWLGLPRIEVDPVSGEVFSALSEAAALSCAEQSLWGAYTAELAYDAAFDAFEGDFESLGFALDRRSGCDRFIALAVTEVQAMGFVLEAVVTRGPGRGRLYRLERVARSRDAAVVDGGHLDEAAVAVWLSTHAWIGSAK